MDLNRLHCFHEVARLGGFTRAQKVLHVGQPAISKTIQALEQELGLTLFERHKRGVRLTQAGQQVFEQARELFATVRKIETIAEGDTLEVRGDVFMSTAEHVAVHLLPAALKRLGKRHPRLVPRVFTGPSELMLPEITEGEHEFGLFFGSVRTPIVETRRFATFPCQIVVRADLANDRSVLRSFIGSREIDHRSTKAFPTLKRLQRERPETQIGLSCNSLEAHKAMVLAGCGVSILPLFVVQSELASGALRVIHPSYRYEASLELVVRKGKELSRGAQAMLSELRREIGGATATHG